MKWPDLNRARTWRSSTAAAVWRWLTAAAVGAVVAALAVSAGLHVHQLVGRDVVGGGEMRLPADVLLGSLLDPAGPRSVAGLSLASLCLLEAGLALLLFACWMTTSRSGEQQAQHVVTRFRQEIHRQAFAIGASDLLGEPRTQPEELLLQRCEQLRQGLVALWQQTPRCLLAALLLLATAALVDPWLTLLAVLVGAVCGALFLVVSQRAEERAHELHGRAAQSESLLVESLKMAPMTAGFSLEEAPGEPFSKSLEAHSLADLRTHLARASLGAKLLGLVLLGAWLPILVVSLSDRLTAAEVATLAASLAGSFYFIQRLLSQRPALDRADSAAQEIFAYLDRPTGLPQSKSPRPLRRLSDLLQLDGVTLEDRQGRRVLDRASCEIRAGQRTALVSSDPLAPAALAGLCARLYDPLEGRVLFDGSDIRGVDLRQLREQTAVVTADAALFTGTVRENICCGEEFSQQQVEEAARRARSLERLKGLSQGLDTIVGPLGAVVPPDVPFRIALARALIRDPSLLIIEEPEPQDDGEDGSLQEALNAQADGRTVVVMPKRLDALRRADSVLLLHRGRLEACGPHATLLQDCELYRHLNYIRFNPYRDAVTE